MFFGRPFAVSQYVSSGAQFEIEIGDLEVNLEGQVISDLQFVDGIELDGSLVDIAFSMARVTSQLLQPS